MDLGNIGIVVLRRMEFALGRKRSINSEVEME
jgi:hypothetical protein